MKNNYFIKATGALFILTFLYKCDSTSTTNQKKDNTEQTTTVKNKSNEQAIADDALEAVKVATPLISKGLENKRYKDSIRAADKEEFWVYTIGVPFDDVDQMADVFKKLKGIENMAVYDNDGEYTLIKTGTSREQLEDDKGNFKTALANAGIGNYRIAIVNLTLKCGKKSHIKYEQSRKLKRKHSDIGSYMCN